MFINIDYTEDVSVYKYTVEIDTHTPINIIITIQQKVLKNTTVSNNESTSLVV